MENILLEEAIKYAERGWYVFPTRETPSKPFQVKTKSGEIKTKVNPIKSPYYMGGFTNATKDIIQIKNWWAKHPEAGIGISCGHSNLVVADIDVRKEKKGFDNFMKLNIPTDGALQSQTPSGGLHFIWSGNIDSHANIKDGIDIRSRGAYIVAPPSWVYEDGQKRSYIKLDDWCRTPSQYPISLEEKLTELRGKKNKANRKQNQIVSNEPIEKTVCRLRNALKLLPSHMAEDYFEWINIGMALKTIGDDGFMLWDEWSRQSSKYDREALEYRWDRFQPKDISIASIFHYAKLESANKNGG